MMKPGKQVWFDFDAFNAAILAKQERDGLRPVEVVKAADINNQTYQRVQHGRSYSIKSVVLLAAWAGLSLDDYVRDHRGRL